MDEVHASQDGRPAGSGEPLLEVKGVSLSYGPLQVLFDVDLTVMPGDQVALLGTNGAGKSSLLRVIAGLNEPRQGSVWFKGQDVTKLRASERVRLGMTLVEGGKATFPSLDVEENLRLGAYPSSDADEVDRRLHDVLELFPPLANRLGQAAGTLSGGEQQMMAVGRALMAAPELLMVDELSLGLAPVIMQSILQVLEQMAGRGITLLVVEQSINIALSLADMAYLMEKGEVQFGGTSEELSAHPEMIRSVFFGGADHDAAGAGAAVTGGAQATVVARDDDTSPLAPAAANGSANGTRPRTRRSRPLEAPPE